MSCVSSSIALGNRVQYPSHFQVLSPDANLANGFFAIIKHFGWRKVALIVQDENVLTTVSSSILILYTATGKFKDLPIQTDTCILVVSFSVFSVTQQRDMYMQLQNITCQVSIIV